MNSDNNSNTTSNLLVKRRKYNRIEDNVKREKVAEANARWSSENPDKKRLANFLFRLKNPDYYYEYRIKKHIEKFGCFPPPRKSNISDFEQLWTDAIKLQFPHLEFVKIRPDWLKNPKTGCNLEIDLFCKEYRLAIEISGMQHFKYISKFHREYDDFIYHVWKDEFKSMTCEQLGIGLIVVSPFDEPLDILSMIQKHIDNVDSEASDWDYNENDVEMN